MQAGKKVKNHVKKFVSFFKKKERIVIIFLVCLLIANVSAILVLSNQINILKREINNLKSELKSEISYLNERIDNLTDIIEGLNKTERIIIPPFKGNYFSIIVEDDKLDVIQGFSENAIILIRYKVEKTKNDTLLLRILGIEVNRTINNFTFSILYLVNRETNEFNESIVIMMNSTVTIVNNIEIPTSEIYLAKCVLNDLYAIKQIYL